MAALLTNQHARVMATNPSAIVGMIRFSIVLQESNFFPPLSRQDYVARKALIFDRARLNRRFQLFEDVCLPSLTAQSDQNFNMMLITSRDLPDWALDRLTGLVKECPTFTCALIARRPTSSEFSDALFSRCWTRPRP